MTKKYTITDATRKRCQIVEASEVQLKNFKQINIELFSYFYETDLVPFPLYVRVEREIIEFMKPEETSKELLNQIERTMAKKFDHVSLLIQAKDEVKLHALFKNVRQKKIDQVMVEAPYLDRKTLELFSDLSQASQMVVRGGLTQDVSGKVTQAASKLVDNLITNTSAVGTLSKMVHCDPTLYDHSAAVAMIASVIAGKLLGKPFNRKGQELVARSGLYHDVGKTCVPNHILNKPDKFTPEEFEIMKTHTTLGFEEIKKAQKEGAEIEDMVARVALEHHERFAGHGYPKQKKGRFEDDPENGIHIVTRIVTIADVYSALLMKRVYKPAFEAGQAIKMMSESYQKDYDPEIFIPFLKHVVNSLNEIQKQKNKGRILILDEGKVKLSS